MPYIHEHCGTTVKKGSGSYVKECDKCGAVVLTADCKWEEDYPEQELEARMIETDYVHTCGNGTYLRVMRGAFDSVWCVECGELGKET